MTDRSTTADGGTYSLLVEIDHATIDVGALGALSFDAGTYVYTGSALGTGGFARVARHREIAAGEREVRHWHLDYLLGAPTASIEGVWTSPAADRECAIASSLPGARIEGFGASDCECEAHLIAAPSRGSADRALDELHDLRGLPD